MLVIVIAIVTVIVIVIVIATVLFVVNIIITIIVVGIFIVILMLVIVIAIVITIVIGKAIAHTYFLSAPSNEPRPVRDSTDPVSSVPCPRRACNGAAGVEPGGPLWFAVDGCL